MVKLKRVIRTLMQMWHDKCEFTNSDHRKQELHPTNPKYATIP
ncbi:hypothetical protein [Moraxella equi]|nr:hypothetical protein [Moraxella equi]